MPENSPKLSWCKIRLGKDLNWWVKETSDKVNWDADGLSLVDPRQAAHMLDTLEGLRDYGLDDSIVEKAFIPFSIDSKIGKTEVKITRSDDSVFDAEEQQLFLLPDSMDDERSPYAEFLDHITKLQVKMLNDTFNFEKEIAIEDLEEEIRENYSNDYMEGRAIHAFHEIMDILEYVPDGYSLEDEDDDERGEDGDDDYADEIEDIDETDEKIEVDETMHWDDDERGEDGDDDPYDLDSFPDDDKI